MIAERTRPEQESSPIIEEWSSYLEDLYARIAHRWSSVSFTELEYYQYVLSMHIIYPLLATF